MDKLVLIPFGLMLLGFGIVIVVDEARWRRAVREHDTAEAPERIRRLEHDLGLHRPPDPEGWMCNPDLPMTPTTDLIRR